MKLLDYSLNTMKFRFTKGAFAFWKKSYALELEYVPKPWVPFATEDKLPEFMFCLETAHTIVSRMILAKVSEDFGLPYVGIQTGHIFGDFWKVPQCKLRGLADIAGLFL